jgi:tRNA pseudouridine38-40 synthase
VGAGRRQPAWVQEVLDARDRQAAGENAPACGLTFWHVEYPEGAIAPTLEEALQARRDVRLSESMRKTSRC